MCVYVRARVCLREGGFKQKHILSVCLLLSVRQLHTVSQCLSIREWNAAVIQACISVQDDTGSWVGTGGYINKINKNFRQKEYSYLQSFPRFLSTCLSSRRLLHLLDFLFFFFFLTFPLHFHHPTPAARIIKMNTQQNSGSSKNEYEVSHVNGYSPLTMWTVFPFIHNT